MKVGVAGDHLEIAYNGITAPLEYWHYEGWNGQEGAKDPTFENIKFQFQGDLKGNVSAVAAQFEPQIHLEPSLGGGFIVKELPVISVVFLEDTQGNVTGANFNQPEGVFTVKKIK